MDKQPLDRIHIRELMARCIVGINPEERLEKQDVIINLTLYGDLSQAAKTDNIEDTVNYKGIKKGILRIVEDSEFFLLERLAEQIAGVALAADRVERVDVSVDKPGALRFARSVAVELTRYKNAQE